MRVRVESCFSPFNAFHTVNSENHSSLCVTLRLPVFPEVFHYPQPNLRLHPSRCFSTYIRRMRISGQTFDYRQGNTLGLCARQRLMIKDSEVCFSPRLSLCTSKNAANFIILLCAESHYGAQVTLFPIYTFHHAASISRYFKMYRVFCLFVLFKDQSCKIRVKEI